MHSKNHPSSIANCWRGLLGAALIAVSIQPAAAGVDSVRLMLPARADEILANLGKVFERQIGQRCGARVILDGEAPLTVELAVKPGIYEDITKVVYSQFYWNDQPAAETVREYIGFEFSPDVVADVEGVIRTLEQNHRMRWWPGKLEGVPLEMNWFPSRGARQQDDPGAEEAYATMRKVDRTLPPQARTSWRWRQLYLRALLDSELKTNGGRPNDLCNESFAELIKIYHAENAIGTVRPPLPKGWKSSR